MTVAGMVCVCGHTAHWHGQGAGKAPASGRCEHDANCKCEQFAQALPDHSATQDADIEAVLGKAMTAEDWVVCAGRWIEQFGDALPEASPMFKALVDVLKECQRRGDALADQRHRLEPDGAGGFRWEAADQEATITALRREIDTLRRRLGERDDFLYEIGKLSKAYETALASDDSQLPEEGR